MLRWLKRAPAAPARTPLSEYGTAEIYGELCTRFECVVMATSSARPGTEKAHLVEFTSHGPSLLALGMSVELTDRLAKDFAAGKGE